MKDCATNEVVVLGASDTSTAGVQLLGGKGASLAAMIEADLPVPATAVVTTDAYRRATLHPLLDSLLAELSAPDHPALDDQEVNARFAEAGLPAGLREVILRARREVAPDGPVAVRSSATTEDLGGASFAGQYVSYIGMATDDQVMDAVSLVWASLWHRAPVLYRRLHGMADDAVAMAVVIQAMVPAVRSGVVFTVDPGGRPEHLRVEHVAGFGEALVSGAVTPDAAVLPRDVTARSVDAVESAVQLALRAERLFGSPQDVEWADDGMRTWLVQSRPITTHIRMAVDDGFDSTVGPHRRYTTAGIAEMLPGVLPALSWSTAGFMVEESFRQVLAKLGALPGALVGAHGFIVRVRGRAALDLDSLAEVATELPGGSAEQLEHEFFGVGSAVTPDENVRLHVRVRHDLRVLATHRFARREQAVTHAAIEAVLDADVDVASLADRELLPLRARLVDLGVRSTAAEFAVAAAAVAAVRDLEQLTTKHFGERDGPQWARRVTRGVPIVGVLRLIADVAGLLGRLGTTMPEGRRWMEARADLVRTGHEDAAMAVERAAVQAGSKRVIGGRAWFEDLDRFWNLVQETAHRPVPPEQPDAARMLEHELVNLPGWRRFRILTGQVVDVRRLMVRRAAFDAVELLGRRETAKADVLALGGQIRAVDLELGTRLAQRGALSHPLDVEHLRPLEIRSAIVSGNAVGLDVVLHRRRAVERWRADEELPMTFTGTPGAPDGTAPPGDRFDGWGASPGRHTGTVRVLNAPDETDVVPGDVVVARRTDAAWLPVFLRAGAVVVEEGGPLSHAAIVARELDVPAVVNVPGVVARLHDESGEVTVDGDLGAVFVSKRPVSETTLETAPDPSSEVDR